MFTIGESSKDEIQVYPGAIYLYPAEDGTWKLIDFGRLNTEESYDDPRISHPRCPRVRWSPGA